MPKLNRAAYSAFAAGLVLLTVLVGYNGAGEVLAALAQAGTGLLVVALFHLGPMLADALGWRSLLHPKPPVLRVWNLRWIGESINGLLPVFQLGGNVVKAQLLARRGVSGSTAAASVVVDVTAMGATQFFFTIVGLALLVRHLGGNSLLLPVLTGLAIMALLLLSFFALQRRGIFGAVARGLDRVGRGGRFAALASGADDVDAHIARLYRDRGALASASAWHLLSWLLGVGEVWLALYFIGHPVDWLTAVLLESLGQAIRLAAFAVPGALGVQEGGYLVLGRAVGLAPETCLALSLAKRVREIVLGLPGLVAWQWEGTMARSEA